MKAIFFTALTLLTSNLAFAAEPIGDWVSFDKEYTFAADVLARDRDLEFWVEPIKEDPDSVSAARSLIAHMDSTTHRENPFVAKIKLAAVNYDYNNQTTMVDEHITQVENALNRDGVGRMAMIRCAGFYRMVNIPLCVIDYEQGDTLQKYLIERGYMSLTENPREVSPELYRVLKAAESEAKKAEIGIWKPFYFMRKAMGG